MREEYRKRGYDEVVTPQIYDSELFRISGHYENYKDNMYFTEIEEREFGVKPMNCPGHHLLFKERLWSYRELPVRFADFGRLHRYERSGVTAGLTRVRTFSQDDSHIYTPVDKVESEVHAFVEFLDSVYSVFGFQDVDISAWSAGVLAWVYLRPAGKRLAFANDPLNLLAVDASGSVDQRRFELQCLTRRFPGWSNAILPKF